MHVLVTGGAGFIGSHLVEQLVLRGDAVRVLDDFSSGRRENLAPWRDSVEIIAADLRDAEQVTRAVQGVEQVFHLAAYISVPGSMRDPQTCFSINVGGTVGLLEAARQAEVARVVLASSTAVYGDTDAFPTTEETPLAPLSPYALSKQINELYASLYTRVFNLPVIALRYFNVYGPRQQPDSPYAAAIPIFVNQLVNGQPLTIFGDGRQSRDFINIRDVVHANLLAAESGQAGEVFNVCSGMETSLIDLLEELSGVSPLQPQVRYEAARPGDIYRSVGSPEKARRLLGFQAQTPLARGLAETIQWMQGR
jgi:UDP-glucose 4-epimerase